MSVNLSAIADRVSKELDSEGKSNISDQELDGDLDMAERLAESIARNYAGGAKVQRNKKSITLKASGK